MVNLKKLYFTKKFFLQMVKVLLQNLVSYTQENILLFTIILIHGYFTKMGEIENVSQAEIKQILGSRKVKVIFSI